MHLYTVCHIHYTHENDSYKIGNIIIQYELDESTVTSICSVNFENILHSLEIMTSQHFCSVFQIILNKIPDI